MELGGIKGTTHWTWAKTYSSRPAVYFRPRSIEHVQQICRAARAQGQTIVVTGAGHSPSRLTMTNSWLVSLDNLNRVLELQPHEGYTDVTVEAGIRLYELNERLASKGLSLQNLGSISEQSIAGVISTGTHGASAYHGLISDQIVSLDLVTGTGEIVTVSDSNPGLFKAVLLSLGAFGIIVRATVRTVEAFALETHQTIIDSDDFFAKLKDDISWFTQNEFHRIWWYPYSRKLVMWHASRTDRLPTAPSQPFVATRFGRFLYELLLSVASIVPPLMPHVERWLVRHQFSHLFESEDVQVARSDVAINMDCLYSQFVNEWAFPLENGHSVLRQLQSSIDKRNFYVHAPIEIRISNTTIPPPTEPPSSKPKKSDTPPGIKGAVHGNRCRPYLDPSPELPWAPLTEISVEQLTLNLNATIYRPFGINTAHQKWFDEVERVCRAAKGRPHWAKNFSARDMSKLYNGQLVEWQDQRAKFDPDGIFGNKNWLQEHELVV